MPLFAVLPSGVFAFLPSRTTLVGLAFLYLTTFLPFFFFLVFLTMPWIVRPSYLWPVTTTPSTYLPGRMLIVEFFFALSTADCTVLYLQPCLQTTRGLCFFPLPARAWAGTANSATASTAANRR